MTSTTATTSGVSAQLVDQEYQKLEKFQVDRRKIVFVGHEDSPQGGFGIVLRAELYESANLPAWLAKRWYGPPQIVAVKQLKIPPFYNVPRVKRAFTREMLVWSSIGEHPGIAKFLGFYADFKRSEAWLLSPWEPNGNVSEFIKAHNLEIPEKLSLIYDTVDALTFLHHRDSPICHGDIKAANVLVTADYKARLCDFGLARLHEESGLGRLETSSGMKGSIRWCSPEILNGAPRAPTSDVYAWAWLAWEIMTGRVPYEDTTVDFVIMRKIFDGLLPEIDGPSRLSDCLQLWDLMTRCWNVDPTQRPTAKMCKTIFRHLPRCTPTPGNAEHQTRSAALLETLGDLESWKGNPEKSSAYLDEALRLYQEEADPKGVASVLRKQVVAAFRISDLHKLRTIATTALEHSRALNDTLGIAESSYYLGHSVMFVGSMSEALPLLRESLEIRRKHEDDVGVVECLERIGSLQMAQHQMQQALSTLGEAMEIATRSGDRLGLANTLHMIGETHLRLFDFIKAAEALSEAITITRSVGWKAELSINLLAMGQLKERLGEYREAEELWQESISAARDVRDRWGLARALQELGNCFRNQSKHHEAAPLLKEACLLWHELAQPSDSKNIASTLVELECDRGDWDGALFWHDHIIAVSRGQKRQGEVAERLTMKGEILVKLQRHDEAALHFEGSIAISEENGLPCYRERALLCAIPKTAMTWERRSPSLFDAKKLQRRLPRLITAVLKSSTPISHAEPYPSIEDQ